MATASWGRGGGTWRQGASKRPWRFSGRVPAGYDLGDYALHFAALSRLEMGDAKGVEDAITVMERDHPGIVAGTPASPPGCVRVGRGR